MPLIWASLTTSHRCREACQEETERKEGWLSRRGENRREGGFPQLVASILLRAEPRFIKRASKIKLKIDAASKHPAPACASLLLPLHPPSAWPSARLR